MAVKDFLDGFQYSPDNFDFEKFKAELTAQHADDLSTREAKIATLSDENAKTAAALQAQKAANFDLLMQSGTPAPKGTTPEGALADEDESGLPTVADLFKKKG